MKISLLSLIALIFGILGACGSSRPRSQAAGAAGVPHVVPARASYELRCPDAQLTIAEIGSRNYAVSGCGAEATYVCVGAMGNYTCQRDGDIRGTVSNESPEAFLGTDVTTSGNPVRNIVIPRSAHDLSCAQESIAVYEIAEKTYVARGCGQDAVYACVGAMGNYQCEKN